MQQSRATHVPSPDELRQATFPQAFKGYDREAVHALLDRVADWVEGGAATVQEAMPDVRRELERVGERTAGILTAAEEAATRLRAEAAEYATGMREAADEEVRRAKLDGARRVEELIAEAEGKAEQIIDEAIARRRKLNQAITSLIERRDEIADEAQRLADELLGAVEAVRADDSEAEAPEAADEPEEAAEAQAELDSEADAEPEDADADAEAGEPTGRFQAEETGEATGQAQPDERETAVHRTG